MISAHGGDVSSVKLNDNNSIEIKSQTEGKIRFTDTKLIGDMVNFLTLSNSRIDINAGMEFFKKDGDDVTKYEAICRIFSNSIHNNNVVKSKINKSFIIEPKL